MTKDVLKYLQPNAVIPIDMETTSLLVNALKEALAQPEQEPVAWGVFEGNLHDMFFTQEEAQEMASLKGSHAEVRPLYTTPPQRTEQRWILVPVTLTNDMTSAMADALEDPNNERSSWDLAENMWQAMLPKVPTPPAQPAETSAERTLRTLGYTNNGGEFWKPPLGAWPPQRTWVGLTEEDRAEILSRKWWDFEDVFDVDGFLRLAEAKLKEKNT